MLNYKQIWHGIKPTRWLIKFNLTKLKRHVIRFKVMEGKLFKRSFQGKWMVCIPTKESNRILSYLNEGEPSRWEKSVAIGFTLGILQAYNAKKCPRLRQEMSRM